MPPEGQAQGGLLGPWVRGLCPPRLLGLPIPCADSSGGSASTSWGSWSLQNPTDKLPQGSSALRPASLLQGSIHTFPAKPAPSPGPLYRTLRPRCHSEPGGGGLNPGSRPGHAAWFPMATFGS